MLRTLPTLQEETPPSQTTPAPTGQEPESGFGALRTARGCLPLEALDVRARLDGLIAGLEVAQTFVNAHPEPLEATYIFPLPDRAAVTRFRLEVAGRVVEGQLRERGRAREEYDAAVRAGHRAAIAEEERPGVFTLRVGNLPPGERARVTLSLVGPLPYADGEATLRFPLVVAPRYVPGVPLPGPSVGAGVAPDTDAAPDASRISPPVLLPGFPNPVRLSLSVEVPPSPLAPHDFRSSLHTIVEEGDGKSLFFRVEPGERLDRDFVLRFRLGADRVQTSLCLAPDASGEEGTFLLTVVPPARGPAQAAPREVVFVLDRSGSMGGWKMVAARRAVARMVEALTERDSFTVLAFDDSVETPPGFDGTRLMPATDRHRFRAAEWLAQVGDRGGTEMAQPLDLAVTELTRSRAGGTSRVLVLITDGQVANEDQIVRELGRKAKGVRIFTLGVDQAVNAGFLRRLADLGGGASEVVESEQRLDEVMDHVHRLVGTPVLTGLRLEPAGLRVQPEGVVPARLPDLFAGAPVMISGRYSGSAKGTITLRASDAAGKSWSAEAPAWRDEQAPLAGVWARGRVRELEDRYVVAEEGREALEKEIVATSLRFGVLCRFTAYVAVDTREVVNPGGQGHTVVQPVELPQGWVVPPASCVAMPVAGRVRALKSFRLMSAPSAGPLEAEEYLAELSDQVLDAGCDDFDGDIHGRLARSKPRAKARKGKAAGGANLLQRLLGLFRRPRKEAGVLDRSPFQPRAVDLLNRLLGAGGDEVARLAALRSVAAELEALFRDLVGAGDRDPSVERLGRQALAMESADEAGAPALYAETVRALQDWLALVPPGGGAGRPEAFWK